MPGVAPVLSDAAIWNVVQFLRALSEADAASALTTQVERLRPLVAPDFTFEIGAGAQESLQQQRGHPTLLVLYALPGSLPRVRTLAAEESRFVAAGVRVIAVRAGDVTGAFLRSEERRVGKECRMPCRSRWSPYH